jgi:hypothetical protein
MQVLGGMWSKNTLIKCANSDILTKEFHSFIILRGLISDKPDVSSISDKGHLSGVEKT